ncbi:MAG: glycosyltransferase [Planctomycetaceae bacterium]
MFEGLTIYHPRYFLPPKIGGYFHPRLMYPAAKRAADRLRGEGFDFDVIDAHFVYPNGVVAALLGERYGVPVVMTGRGEDMLRFPDMPFKGRRIRTALRRAGHCIALTTEIAEAMKRHGAADEKVAVIPNGVDTALFRPLPQRYCREVLGLPIDAPIILSIGDRLKLKGFHLLVDALPRILEAHPHAILAIVGGPGRHGQDYTAEIVRRVENYNLQDRVLMAGHRPHRELPLWHNSADLFALLSSREGSPNVLLEALACGRPAIGTSVGGILDELSNADCGSLLLERTAAAAATTIIERLNAGCHQTLTRSPMEHRHWNATAVALMDSAFRLDS